MKAAKSKAECVKAICRFPRLYSQEGLSPREIVKKSGYWEFRDEISIADIEDEIRSDPELIDLWIRFTDDKRWTPGWGLGREDEGFRVFYVFRGGKTELEKAYADGCAACARMVRFEMEGIGTRTKDRVGG